MKRIVDLDRLLRLRQTEGTPIHIIIDNRLVKKEDWVEFCGADYPSQKGKWIKGRDGSKRYIGPSPIRKRF